MAKVKLSTQDIASSPVFLTQMPRQDTSGRGMATRRPYPRPALWLLLLLLGDRISTTIAIYVIKTSGGSEEEVSLPDEQAVRLLFWVEGTGGQAPEGEEREAKKAISSTRENQEEEVEESVLDPDVTQGGVFLEESTISIGYIVSILQYPRLYFTVPERDVWLSAHFYHNGVYIPAANRSLVPRPHSWWDRRVKVSSEPSVYWHLCPSPYECAPGAPPYFLQNTTVSTPEDSTGLDRILVIALGAACGVLLLVCLALIARVRHLQRRPSSQQRSQARTQINSANQNTSYF